MSDAWTIGDLTLDSRVLLGTSRYPSRAALLEALEASGTQLVTVSLRRVAVDATQGNLYEALVDRGYHLLPNTAGCHTADEAVRTAHLAREALGTPLIKVEVIFDNETLLPDGEQLLLACEQLVRDGFTVLPYTNDDPVLAAKLEQIGCAAVMPLAAPIGSGLGIQNRYNLLEIVENAKVPVLVDAGVGTASDAAIAMELGCDGVLMNTAIAGARDPLLMAHAMKLAIQAGRAAFRAGRIPRKRYASASSPIDGTIG